MMTALQPFVPAQVAGLPKPSLALAKAEMRAAGIGNLIGMSSRGSIGAVEERAVRMQATARFSLWGIAVFDVDQVLTALTTSIFAKRADLQAQGFLKLSLDGSLPAEHTKESGVWRRFADYDILYEFTYQDVGEAASLIRPISAQDTPTGEQWAIMGDLARWDDAEAPPLVIRGPAIITELAALAFFADAANPPTGGVTITRTFDDAPAPADAGTLAAFLAQITASGSPARNALVNFASVSDLLAQFAADGVPMQMGDRNQNGTLDTYVPTHVVFPAPLTLPSVTDRLELAYGQAKFDRTAVVYLRAIRQGV
jgi:hypothetical protein